jgi:hypothetical protein
VSLQRLRRTFEGRAREMGVRADRDKAEIYEGMVTLTRDESRRVHRRLGALSIAGPSAWTSFQ